MICPHDNRRCARPRCAVCPMVEIDDEREALAALFAVAALSGGYVMALYARVASRNTRVLPEIAAVGYGVVPIGGWDREPMWIWWSEARLYGIDRLAGNMWPGGRVDRGLGAITAADMKPARPQRLRTPRAGPECPTD